jgi:hypothetical protein
MLLQFTTPPMRQCAASLRKSSLTTVDTFLLLLVEPVLKDMLCYARLHVGIVSTVQYVVKVQLSNQNSTRASPMMPLLEVEIVPPSGNCAAGRLERPLSNRQPVLGGRRSYSLCTVR